MKNTASPISQKTPSVIALIPARYASSRLPGKPLVDLCGKPMIQRVYEQAQKAATVSRVLVATDDHRIFDTVVQFGGEAVLTRPDHPTGTDRLAEVATSLKEEIIVNVQGDEPLISPHTIDAAVEPLLRDCTVEMATTCEALRCKEEILNPNVVKVVCDQKGFALYFSRAPIPHLQGSGKEQETERQAGQETSAQGQNKKPTTEILNSQLSTLNSQIGIWFKHTGLYVYRREFLLYLAGLEPSPLEKLESLEQLRVLYYGHRIKVIRTEHASPGVDTPEDVERVRQFLKQEV